MERLFCAYFRVSWCCVLLVRCGAIHIHRDPRERVGRQLHKRLLKQWRIEKHALKEAEMNVKDTRKLEEFSKCMGISFWWKSLQIEGETREEQVRKQRNLGHDGRVRQRAEWEILDPQDREWETDTSCACDKKKTKLTSSSTGIVMVRSREIWRR